MRRKIPTTEHQSIINQYLSGESAPAIATSYGVANITIFRILWQSNTPMRTNERVRKPLAPCEVAEEIRHLFDFESQCYDKELQVMLIMRMCKSCAVQELVQVPSIRDYIKKGTYTGVCPKCSRTVTSPHIVRGSNHPQWKGGRVKNQQGYVMVRHSYGPASRRQYVLEHRLVMEQHIGRKLLPYETVHHRNGNKQDNRIENLELWAKNHQPGQRYEDLGVLELNELIIFLQVILDRKLAAERRG